MLTALSIRDVLLIEALDLELGEGLTVLTGETGAGKSILLDSLGLALGARADSGLVRAGAGRAMVSATFSVPSGHALNALLRDHEIDLENGEVVLRRAVRADGGSRAWINDQPAAAGLLRDVGALLVEVHGQHDERGLLDARGHRALLDTFGRHEEELRATSRAYEFWKVSVAELEAARTEIADADRDREYLDHAIAELEALQPEPGEEAALAEERAGMLAGQRVAEDLTAISEELSGADGGAARLRAAARRLGRIAESHALLDASLQALDRALLETDEAEAKLAAAGEALAFDEARLDAVETRLFDLRGLARKHRVEADRLSELLSQFLERRTRIERGSEQLASLEQAVKAAATAYDTAAAILSQKRTAAAERLDAAVAAELAPLKLDAARFRTAISPLPQGERGAAGADRVAFEISTNPGADFGPLVKIASGGELSRFILALKVALAGQAEAGTMIFDEIDRGVGGATASAIGARLARLAEDAQVLTVTHSPQVAARGAHHLHIEKRVQNGATRTNVAPLPGTARTEEIARMLSGTAVTDEARAQAARLLA